MGLASKLETEFSQKLREMDELGNGIHKHLDFKSGCLTAQLQVGNPNDEQMIMGCYTIHIIEFLLELQRYFNENSPCVENEECMAYLSLAKSSLVRRSQARKAKKSQSQPS